MSLLPQVTEKDITASSRDKQTAVDRTCRAPTELLFNFPAHP